MQTAKLMERVSCALHYAFVNAPDTSVLKPLHDLNDLPPVKTGLEHDYQCLRLLITHSKPVAALYAAHHGLTDTAASLFLDCDDPISCVCLFRLVEHMPWMQRGYRVYDELVARRNYPRYYGAIVLFFQREWVAAYNLVADNSAVWKKPNARVPSLLQLALWERAGMFAKEYPLQFRDTNTRAVFQAIKLLREELSDDLFDAILAPLVLQWMRVLTSHTDKLRVSDRVPPYFGSRVLASTHRGISLFLYLSLSPSLFIGSSFVLFASAVVHLLTPCCAGAGQAM